MALYTAKASTRAKLGKRRAYDFYPTSDKDVHASYRYLFRFMDTTPKRVLDIGAGEGPWGRVLKSYYPACSITGVEIRASEWMRPEGYDHWRHGDFLTMPFYDEPYDCIIGNPPFNIAEELIRKAQPMLTAGGFMFLLLPLNFWATQSRAKGLFREIRPFHVAPYAKRLSFTGDGKTDAHEYALYGWRDTNQSITTTDHIIQDELLGGYQYALC